MQRKMVDGGRHGESHPPRSPESHGNCLEMQILSSRSPGLLDETPGLGCSLCVRTSSVGDRESSLNLGGGRGLGRLGWGMSVNVLNSFTNHGIIKTYCKVCVQVSTALLAPGRRKGQGQSIKGGRNPHLPDPSLLKGRSSLWTPGHQTGDLPTLRWWPALPPLTLRLSQQGCRREQCAF